MHDTLNLLSRQNRRDFHVSVSCHKSIYFQGRSNLVGFYVPILSVTGLNTRQVDTCIMKVFRTRTKMCQYAISVRGPRHWNKLPPEIRQTKNFTQF